MNPLGIPETLAGWREHAAGLRALAGAEQPWRSSALYARVERDLRIAEATGRWPIGNPHGVEPVEYVPGDVLAIRALAAVWENRDDLGPGHGVCSRLLLDAVPYFLPGPVAVALLGSHAPPAEAFADLRLPFDRVAVYFGRPLVSPTARLVPDGLAAAWAADLDGMPPEGFGIRPLLGDTPFARATGDAVTYDPDDQPDEVAVEAVLLFAGDGMLRDEIAWVCSARTPASLRSRPARSIVPARRSLSTWADPVASLAAAVAWADWTPPQSLELPERLVRRDLRDLRRGPTRRAEQSGALAGVHVIDATPTSTAPTTIGSGHHASPIAHLRRGHWRAVRVGPRRAWRHEARWIAPTIVNPAHGAPRTVVYRLPPAERSPL